MITDKIGKLKQFEYTRFTIDMPDKDAKLPQHHFSDNEIKLMQKEIDTLLTNDIIKQVKERPIVITHLIIIFKKEESKIRIVHDFRFLNMLPSRE